MALVKERGFRLGNADITVFAQQPKLAPHRQAMREQLAAALDAEPAAVNIKATTGEKLGYIGRGEGMLAEAVVLLESVAP